MVFRNVGSCILGLQAATTTRFKWCSFMAFLISSCPGSAHVYRFSFTKTTSGIVLAYSTTCLTSTTLAMFWPQWQTKTPIRAGSACLAVSAGFCVSGLLILHILSNYSSCYSFPCFLGRIRYKRCLETTPVRTCRFQGYQIRFGEVAHLITSSVTKRLATAFLAFKPPFAFNSFASSIGEVRRSSDLFQVPE